MSAHQIPVFMGITGKRVLHDDPAENERLAQVVRARIDKVLDRLDQELPRVTKILLTGGAAGVDLIAARRVLGLDGARPRPDWFVTVVLPFAKDLFREDFEADEWELLEEVLAHPRARCTELPRLRTDLARPPDLDAATDPLSRANQDPQWQDERRRHYEQVGLWIVDTANILLAVMRADEAAEKVGGTARVVACRRSGRPDDIARSVIAASEAPLAPRPDLVRPPQQYVWLIDPAAAVPADGLPVAVLPPMVEQGATAHAYSHPGEGEDPGRRKEHLQDSLAAAVTIQRLGAGPRAAEAEWPAGECPATLLQGMRHAQRPVRRHTQVLSKNAFTWLGALFVLAVLAFEVFAKFFPGNHRVLLVYGGLLGLILALYHFAKRQRWQPDAEDSRAIAELLRLQHAWWRAGLASRVDHFHLLGADQDLARVREGARNAVVWAELAGEGGVEVKWPEVWQAPSTGHHGARRDWVGEQVEYFARSEHARETNAKRVDVLSWVLFITSFVLALLLAFWLGFEPARHIVDNSVAGIAAGGATLLAIAGAIGVGLAVAIWRMRAHITETNTWPTFVLTLEFGLLAALGLALGLRMFGELLGNNFPSFADHHHPANERFTLYLMIIAIVLLPAIAGAMRFVAEKRAYEAEALSYREALRWFEHADELLAEQPPGRGNDAADARARAIVEALGRLALAENENWLKSRRERPLTPVIGG